MKKRILSLAMALAMLAVLVMPMAAFAAADSGTSTVGGAVTTTFYSISVPSTITLPTLVNGAASVSAAQVVKSTTNDAAYSTVTVSVIGSDGTAPGALGRGDRANTAGNEIIAPVLKITSTNLGFTALSVLSATVAGTAQTLVSGVYTASDVVITQPIITSAPPVGTYITTLAFTATFNTP